MELILTINSGCLIYNQELRITSPLMNNIKIEYKYTSSKILPKSDKMRKPKNFIQNKVNIYKLSEELNEVKKELDILQTVEKQ